MLEKIIDVPVTPQDIEETENLNAGVMFEHNVTALNFQLDTVYQSPDFTYYLEFVTVNGVLRTDYITPHTDGTILFYLPQEVTSQMTALAVLNIVTFAPDGQTEQLKKSKTVRLYFSNLENTEKELCDSYAFSVNMLLEAIQKGTFKGETGKTGPMGPSYTLLPTDKQEIADLVNHEHFGLPLYTRETGQKSFSLPKMTNWSTLRSLQVSATSIEEPLTMAKVVVGHNRLDYLLSPTAFSRVRYNKNYRLHEIYYGSLPVQHYTLTALNMDACARLSYLRIDADTKDISVEFESQLSSCPWRQDFEVQNADNYTVLRARDIDSQEEYNKLLNKEWDGLTLTDADKSVAIFQKFEEPLLYLSEEYKDSFDFISGKITKRTQKLDLLPEYLSAEPTYTIQTDTGNLYMYRLLLPSTFPRKRYVVKLGYCDGLPLVPSFIRNTADYVAATERGEATEGLCIATRASYLAFYSRKTAEEIKAEWTAILAQKPITAIYPITAREFILAEPLTLTAPPAVKELNISPRYAKATVEYPTDISEKTIELESRILALENRMQGETL